MVLRENDHVLFFGDSITDAGRQGEPNPAGALGRGYAFMIATRLWAAYPSWDLKFTNRGISGNRIRDLELRLQGDVMDAKPTVVSILIGINDTWRQFDQHQPSPVDKFQDACRRILRRVTGELTDRVIVCEPFLLPIPADRRAWREDLDAKIHAIRALAREFHTHYLPLDGIFAAAATRTPMDYWLPDGVHPTPAGHALIAEHWLRLVGI